MGRTAQRRVSSDGGTPRRAREFGSDQAVSVPLTQTSASFVGTALPQRIVIAGGPGSGKSTLLRALAEAGEVCYEESSRVLIREQLARAGRLVPWDDLSAFARECSERMRAQLADSARHGRCFFDRGLPDLIGYLSRGGYRAPDA